MLEYFSLLKCIEACAVGKHKIYFGERSWWLWANVCSAALGSGIVWISTKSIWSNVSLKAGMFPYCLSDGWLTPWCKRGTRIPCCCSITVSLFRPFNIALTYLGAPLGAQIFTNVVTSSHWIDPFTVMLCVLLSLVPAFPYKSVLSDRSIAPWCFFWFPFAWNIFLRPFMFDLCVSLHFRWVCFRPQTDGSGFANHSGTLSFSWSI